MQPLLGKCRRKCLYPKGLTQGMVLPIQFDTKIDSKKGVAGRRQTNYNGEENPYFMGEE